MDTTHRSDYHDPSRLSSRLKASSFGGGSSNRRSAKRRIRTDKVLEAMLAFRNLRRLRKCCTVRLFRRKKQ